MGDDHALRVGGGAGGEDDFGGIVRGQRRGQISYRLIRGWLPAPEWCQQESDRDGDLSSASGQTGRAGSASGALSTTSPARMARASDDLGDPEEERCRRAIVDGDEDDAFEQASPERHDPLGAVLAPDGD